MKYTSPSRYYQLAIPENWKVEEDENTISIYNEGEGLGAITITSYLIPETYSFDIRKELIDFVDNTINNQKDIKEYNLQEKKIAEIDIKNDKGLWRFVIVFAKQKALFISYNSDVVVSNEINTVSHIIASINII
ncbi:hypothetical protein PQ469_22280 [Mucilaginibacter sp. KACC 22773]|jgi:hypothetical protein|uniref:hypothetical protein n=1 Tax=Mucilaginibacter sp. KACC 22773 TaxID=3025671 RepID=UPI002366FE09|nr:hypothetical protein [Mucilaginibacter sp. KACC 22773]WDF76618.1 hypothetical protein PQ469_22280 [Mucilaginibacter sp. KACC 22773]